VDPHIILLHIGTNDMVQGSAGAPERLAELVDQILADRPDALLAVATIVPLPSSANAVDTFNAAIRALVEELANAGEHVILVDQFTGFPGSGLENDNVHPNEQGYARMAEVWYGAISTYLP
jgi:lysophospholipase L1-like esterase